MTKCILLIHAEGLPAQTLAEQLAGQGFAVRTAPPFDAASAGLFIAEPVDLMLLDAPSLNDPVAICQALRAAGGTFPIVVLGAAPADETALKEAGADDCLAKPFRMTTLLARIREQARDSVADEALVVGDFRLYPIGRRLVDSLGREIRLTEKEAAILVYLYRAGRRAVSRDELLGEVWGYSDTASTHTVETHIYRLRRKLDEEVGASPLLSTEDGGYRLGVGSLEVE
ncbi:response regulator transcription factor [Telmatospirillum sp.]|uniref:response regulator transcription factor n=1 Tax=Telmatospirillum sp. TaxID=2079197 RepID=UPI0028429493|nr:response regulator transcription factor [Telmatospirillum sp.]MDR3439582.1 response regulator transcription factor [Telmatospirillum sp.]